MTDSSAPDEVPAPRRGLGRWLQLALALALIGPAVAYAVRAVMQDASVQERLRAASFVDVAEMCAALFAVMTMNGLVLRELVAHLGVRLPVRAWLGVTLVASMLNLVSPISGAGAMRGIYLKRVYGIPYTSFAGVLAVAFAFSVAATCGLALAALLWLGIPGGGAGWVALVVSVVPVVALVAALMVSPAMSSATNGAPATGRLGKLREKLARAWSSWRDLSANRGLVLRLALWSVLGACLHGVAFVVAFRVAGFDGDALVPVASSAFARIGALVSVTPAGLGVYEAFAVVSGQIVGAASAQALLGVLIVRGCSMALSIVGGAAFSPLLVRMKGRES